MREEKVIEIVFDDGDFLETNSAMARYYDSLISKFQSDARVRCRYSDVTGFDPGVNSYPSDETLAVRRMLREYDRIFSSDPPPDSDEEIHFELPLPEICCHHPNCDFHDCCGDIYTEGDVEEFQSGPIEDKVMEHKENLLEVDGNVPVETYLGKPRVPGTVSKASLELSDFFSRPVQILSATIPSLTNYLNTLDPWSLYLAEPSVRAKLKNYAYLRANMKLKFTISGTPFHLGKILIAYVPFGTYNDVLNNYISNAFAPRAGLLKYLSQTRGCKIMDVHDNEPLEMDIPYISPNPFSRLYNNDSAALPSATSYDDFIALGKLLIMSLNQVNDCSGSATAVNMYVYASMHDVRLGCLTASPYVVTTEGKLDERKVGPLQRLATNVSDVSKALVSVPWISPYAKASEMISSGIASVASLFGWSVATIETAPSRMKNEPYQNACHTIGYDTGQRLTMDPKQEITVDHHFFATEKDEMVIKHIASIESLLDTFTWTNSSTPMTPLWKSLVTPTAVVPDITASTRKVQPTALSFAALPFNYWRGKIKFKLQVVATQFHRGKFAILFEPDVTKDVLIFANLKLNKQYLAIVDISATQEFEFCVDWSLPTPWRQVAPYTYDTTTGTTFPSGAALTEALKYANGMVYIVPLTKLQSPNATGVSINVFISCEDLRVQYPDDYRLPLNTVWTEGDVSMKDTTCLDINPLGTHDRGISLDTFGEEVLSFRSLLKKFWETEKLSVATTTPCILYGFLKLLPTTYPTPTANAIRAQVSIYGYLKYAFMGLRGGIKKRFRTLCVDYNPTDTTVVGINTPSSSIPASSLSAGAISARGLLNMLGSLFFVPRTNAGIEFEAPYYSNNYFGLSFYSEPFPSVVRNFEPLCLRDVQYNIEVSTTSTSSTRYLTESTAFGEDFTLGYFVAAPNYRSL
jgi:hypothetical protein